MLNPVALILLILLITSAIIAIIIKDLLASVILFGVYSLIMAIIWQQLKAPDLAITEAIIGIVISVMLVALISKTSRWEE